MFVNKHRVFFDFAQEERWLTELSEKGYAFVSAGYWGRHTFAAGAPRRYEYRLDYRMFRSGRDFTDYKALFEDSGWKHLWGTKSSGTQYFVRLRPDAPDDIFSDAASRAGRYRRFCSMWASTATALLPITIVCFLQSTEKWKAITDPKSLYLTPGLWQMHGARFWRAFLFETPFAVGRGFWWIAAVLALAFFTAALLRAWRLYRRSLHETGKAGGQ